MNSKQREDVVGRSLVRSDPNAPGSALDIAAAIVRGEADAKGCGPVDATLDAICRTTARLLGTPFASISVFHDAHLRHLARVGIGADRVPRDIAFCTWTVRGDAGEATVVPDAAADPRFADNPYVIGAPHLRFYAGLKLKLSASRRQATLCVTDVKPRPDFGDEQVRALEDMASLVEARLDLLAENERRRRETETLRVALDGMAQGLIVVDAEDRVRISNGRAAELLGVPAHLLREGSLLDGVRRHQADRGELAGLPEPLRQWLETGDPAFWVPLYERESAGGAVIEVRSRPLDGGGTIRTITDVTAQRAAERAAQDGERRYRLIADNVNDVIIGADLDMVRRYVSPSVKTVLGYEPAELVGGHPAGLVHPDDLDLCLRVGGDITAGRSERGLMTLRCRHKDGHWVWLEMSSRLAVDPGTGSAQSMVATLRDVTARKLAEDGLRFSEARHRALVDALPQMMVIVSAQTGEALYSNRQFKNYFGPVLPARESRVALVHPDDIDRYQELWVNARARQGRYEGEVRLRRRDGAHRWHKMVMVPIVQDGAIHTVVSTALDIDEIVAARRELERTSDLLRLAQAAAGAGIWEWEPVSDRISLSPASARMHGLPAAGEAPTVVPLAAWKARVVPEDLPAVQAAVERTRAEGTTNVSEYRTLTPELPGGRRWVQSFGHAATGGDTERFVGLHLDVTARREAEEALRVREAQLRVNEERLSLALDSGDDGLFDADVEHGTHWVSRRWVERLGYGPDAGHRPMAFWWDAIHPDDMGRFAAEMEAHFRGLSAAVEHEHRMRRADGSYIWVLARARVVGRSASGEPLRVVGTLIDVSQRKEAELRIRHMAEHDALTGLPNRRVIDRRLAEAVNSARGEPERHAMLICDIDRFKAVNDTLGHSAGDRVLCDAAGRIRSAVRQGDVVARLGGTSSPCCSSTWTGATGPRSRASASSPPWRRRSTATARRSASASASAPRC